MTRPGYKMTEIEEIPKNWNVKSLDNMIEILDLKRVPLSETERANKKGTIPYCGANGIIDYIDDYIFDEEAVLIAEDGGNYGKFQNKAYIMTGKYWVNNHAHIFRGRSELLENKFIMQWLNFSDISPYVSGSTRTKLNQEMLKRILVPTPSLQEQQKIAEILSTADETIQKVNEEIMLTERLKKGLMQTLLTKGIGHTKFKMTEIGEIPEEWEVVNLNSLTYDFKNGFSSGKRSSEGVVQVRMNNISTDGRLLLDSYIRVPAPKNLTEYTLENGDFLFNNTNSIDLVGKSAVFNGAQFLCTFSNHFTRFRFYPDRILPEMVLLQFIILWETGIFKSFATRYVGQASISTDLLLHMAVKVPPMQEQIKIRKMSRILNQKLSLLYYRKDKIEILKKGLMQSLLTGKLRIKVYSSKGEN